jgi:sugar phosphate permease
MSQASPEKLRRDALGILAAAIAAQLAVSTAQQGLPALGPILASTFNLTTSGVGLLLGTISLGTAGAVIFWGNLADRIDDRLVALIGLLGTATCFVIAAFFKASEVAHFALIFAGIMMASPTVAMTKGLARNFVHLGNIGFALSTRQAAVPVGGVIGGIVLTGIAVSHGLSAALYALAALIILGGLFVMFAPAGVPEPPRLKAENLPPVNWRRLSPILIAAAFFCLTQLGIVALLTLYLSGSRGWTPTQAGQLYALMMAFVIPLRIRLGVISDRYPTRRVQFQIVIALLGATLLLLCAVLEQYAIVVPLLFLAGISAMGWNGLLFTTAVVAVPPERVGFTQGVLHSFIFAAGGVSPIIMSQIVESFSWQAAWTVMAICSVMAAVSLKMFDTTPVQVKEAA